MKLRKKIVDLEHLFFPDDVKALINVIGLWVKSKDWYKKKNIPWKRGWLCRLPQKQYVLKVDKMFNFKNVKHDEKKHIQSCTDCGHTQRVR